MTTEVFWPDLLPIREQFSPARVNTFWISKVSGNPYATREMFRPAAVSETFEYLENPGKFETNYGDRNTDIMQNVVFDSWELDQGRLASDVPDGLYEWIHDGSLSPEDIRSRVLEIRERGGEKYLPALQKYLTDVASLGEEREFSNSPFVIDLMSLSSNFHVQGETDLYGDVYRGTVRLAGQFNEIRNDRSRDTIIRVRQRSGRPSLYDAINLGINNFAFQAENSASGQDEKPEPRFLVFNLVDGKMYQLKIFSGSFYKEIGNAIFFSYLARRAGFVPEEVKGISEVDYEKAKQHERTVVLKKGKKKKNTLTAEELFNKAKNCLKRLNGEPPHSRRYAFVPIESFS